MVHKITSAEVLRFQSFRSGWVANKKTSWKYYKGWFPLFFMTLLPSFKKHYQVKMYSGHPWIIPIWAMRQKINFKPLHSSKSVRCMSATHIYWRIPLRSVLMSSPSTTQETIRWQYRWTLKPWLEHLILDFRCAYSPKKEAEFECILLWWFMFTGVWVLMLFLMNFWPCTQSSKVLNFTYKISDDLIKLS